MNGNKYIQEWNSIMSQASTMLEAKNYDAYNNLLQKANKVYEAYKLDNDLTYMCNNFGMANYIFEDALPKLFKTNQKAVKEFITTIKEDKNLRTEFNFFKALERYNSDLDIKEYINESLELATSQINPRTLQESNNKLAKLITKYEIKPSDFIPEDKLKMYEECDYLLRNKKKLNNINEYNHSVSSLAEYTTKNYNYVKEEKSDLGELVEAFDKKYSNLLNEEEKSFVKEILDWKSDGVNENKKALFNKFKNECIKTVDNLLKEATDSDKEGLLAIKEQLENKQFCQESLVKDIAKLLEIRDILMSE